MCSIPSDALTIAIKETCATVFAVCEASKHCGHDSPSHDARAVSTQAYYSSGNQGSA